ncbi:sphingomyelin phosphodiesterase 4 [Octopus sinensis]|uniref:Sphingomyelin phosphodiesterase 4 n=1 Tax=Octopus sinensis TaxID=2607531 RepID=A0A6P7T0E0_9MOLL|nr:sphingomyelin phosphodiesterase 4 [Octopus sinensis]
MAAMTGGSLSILVEFQNAISKPLLKRFEMVTSIIMSISTKEAHHIFPTILESIFGFGHEPGWNLEYINKIKTPEEYEYGRAFLSPNGPLMKLVYRLQSDPYLSYDFPLHCLPAPTRRLIEEGAVPVFYANKLQMQAFGRPYLTLTPFELFLFHFAFMLVSPKSRLNCPIWGHFSAFLYPTLVEDYLDYLLPLEKQQIPAIPHMPSLVRSPVIQSQNTGSPIQSSHSSVSPKYIPGLRLFKSSVVTAQKQPFKSPSVLDQSGTEMWHSEALIQVFSDFWLNQNSANVNQLGVLYQNEELYVPTINHIRIARVLVKHLHYFVNSALPPISSPPYYQQLPTSIDQFKKTTVLGIIQKRLYTFLRHAFHWWPLDSSFRLLLETWLSYIQPWRYVSQTKPNLRSNNEEDDNAIIQDRWYSFVVDNLLFYSAIFHQILPRFFRMDLTSPHNAYMMFRITKVFSNPNLVAMLHKAEEEMYQPIFLQASTSRDIGGSYLSPDHRLNAALNVQISELERPGFQYLPLFDRTTVDTVRKLLINIAHAKKEVRASEQAEKSSQFNFPTIWLKMASFFNPNNFSGDSDSIELQRKTRQHLEMVENQLQYIFDIAPPEVLFYDDNKDNNSNLTNGDVHKQCQHNETLPDFETTYEGKRLTDVGRHQLMNRLRTANVSYQGDPDLQPVRSFENGFLVQNLYNICCQINNQCSTTIHNLYYREDFLGRVMRAYIQPPLCLRDFYSPNQLRITSMSSKPHISLRLFASYYILFRLLLLYLILYLCYDISFITYFIILFLIIFFYGIVHGIFIKQPAKPPPRNRSGSFEDLMCNFE